MVFKLIRTVLGLDSSDSPSGTDVTVEREPEGESDAAAAGTDASGSTGSMTEEPPEEGATEPAEAAGPTSGDGDGAGEASVPVDEVSGIGPAYAERLGEAGIETVAQLLDADTDELADRTDLSAKRIGRWQERAAEL